MPLSLKAVARLQGVVRLTSGAATVNTPTGPVTDPAVTAINADGWSAQDSAAGPPNPSSRNVVATRQGFDGTGAPTTYTDTIPLTQRVRLPYPQHASLDTTGRTALADYLYATDTVAGTVNNSGEVSPKPIVNWARPANRVAGNTLPREWLEVVAFHRNARQGEQAAAVVWTISDGTNTVTVTRSVSEVSGHPGDRNAVIVYRPAADVSIAGLSPGTITINAKVYPWIGGAASVADSATSSIEREFSPRQFLKDVTKAANPPLAYVSATGNDTTGVVSTTAATASASPFATVLAAINAIVTSQGALDGARIRVGAGTFVLGSTAATRPQGVGELIIERDPAVARAQAVVTFGAATFRTRFPYLRFSDITVRRTGTLTLQGEATGTGGGNLRVAFENVDFDNGGNNATWLNNAHDYHLGTAFTNLTGNSALGAGTSEHRLLRGISVDIAYGNIEGWLMLGSSVTRPGLFGRGTRSFSGGIVAFSTFRDPTSAGVMLNIGADQDMAGFAIVQNLIEYVSATAAAVIRISGDSATGNNSHIILYHNTLAGAYQAARWNAFYDEGAARRTSKLMSVVGNIGVANYTKSDVFRGQVETGADAAQAVGNWPYEYQVGCAYNFWQFQSNTPIGGNEAPDYAGLGTVIGTSTSVRNDPLFIAYAGTTYNGTAYTAGTGGGTYTIPANSPAAGIVANRVLRFDLLGLTRKAASDDTGAFRASA